MGLRNDNGHVVNNERLEFLGDAVLGACVGDIVFRHFPNKREGFLTNTRSKIVQRKTLNKLSNEMGITKLVHSNGTMQSHNSYLGGNAFEALVGALYLDQGYEACMKFVEKRILAEIINIDKVAYKEVNFKSKLLEWTQKNRVRMEFQMLKETTDQQGSPVFGFIVKIEGIDGGKGQGYSKKEAQQLAAKETLQQLRREPQFVDAIFSAKSNRTKMEEEPTAIAPDLEAEKEFIIKNEANESVEPEPIETTKATKKNEAPEPSSDDDEFDLSDISHMPQDLSREDIIAAAEAAAYES